MYVDIKKPGVIEPFHRANKYPDHQVGAICYYEGDTGVRFYLITERSEISSAYSGNGEPMLGMRLLMNDSMKVTDPKRNTPVVRKSASWVKVVTPEEYLEYLREVMSAINTTADVFREKYIKS